jgi:hypothetical protein
LQDFYFILAFHVFSPDISILWVLILLRYN